MIDSLRSSTTPRRRVRSLRFWLLVWIVPMLLLVSLATLWSSTVRLKAEVEAAYDRALAGVLNAIDINISTEHGGLALTQPYRLLEFFDLTATGNVYYHVATEDGLTQLGHAALPLPPQPLRSGELQVFDATYLDDEPVRVAVMARPLSPPLHKDLGVSQRVLVQVAESLEQRERFVRNIVWRGLARDLAFVVLSVGLLMVIVIVTMRPLARLRQEVRQRSPDDLRPVNAEDVPAEVMPLVEAVNHHMERYARQAQAQRQFLDDASHQLRTPLTVLRTQLDYALRDKDPEEMRQSVQAMRAGLDRAIRVTNQMLALARAQHAVLPEAAAQREHFALETVVEECTRLLLPAARAKRIDYALDLPPESVPFAGAKLLLQEAIVNIIDNAIRYTPEGGTIVVALHRHAGQVSVSVTDSGPGMSEEDRRQAGIRFRRGESGRRQQGAGLGLAIVASIVELHQGELRLSIPENDIGLRVELVFSLGDIEGGRQLFER